MKKRGDQVPLVLAQSTARNNRLCSLLSALLLRQPSPPLDNRLVWQFFDPCQSKRNTVFLVLREEKEGEDGEERWIQDDFVVALKDYIQPSTHVFCFDLSVDSHEQHFARRWERAQSILNHVDVDIFLLVGSETLLFRISQHLVERPNKNIKGIVSILATSKNKIETPLPYFPDDVYHWIIYVTNKQEKVKGRGAIMVLQSATTLCLTLSSWPSTPWILRALVFFANSVHATSPLSIGESLMPQARL